MIIPLNTLYDVITPFTFFLILIPSALYSYVILLFKFVSEVKLPSLNVTLKSLNIDGVPLL